MKYYITTLLTLLMIQTVASGQGIQKKIQTALIKAQPGDTIRIPEGTFHLDKSLWLDNGKNLVILGKGMHETILSFKNQVEGAEGIKITGGENITVVGMTIQDSKGDALKAQETNGIAMIDVKTEWTGKPKKTNGSYGLYPVNCTNVLIDGCIAIGASDAGIYVGQSKDIVVKNSIAHHNVAGIEIENSINALVFDNKSYQNTGGILVFDLPDLIQKKGYNVKVFDNLVTNNNLPNFAPKGNIVGMVPDGTGVIILATSKVEVFDNKIINNNTASMAILSYYMTEEEIKDEQYDPFPKGIFVHNNYFERENVKPTFKGRMGKMFHFKLKFGKDVPHIIYDGILETEILDETGNVPDAFKICIRDNVNQTFVNIDAENDFKNMSTDLSVHNCSQQIIVTSNQQ